MSKATINVQVPAEWKDTLQEIADERHMGLSDVVRQIFLDHLNKSNEDARRTTNNPDKGDINNEHARK